MAINKLSIAVITSVLPALCIGQAAQPEQCKAEQAAVTSVSGKYKKSFDDYQREGEGLKDSDEAATFKVDITWKDTEMRFGTPSVTIKDQKIVFGVPQVTMKMQEIIFGTPSVRMEQVKTGQYPEITCRDTWITVGPLKTKGVPECTTTWSNTYASVPVTFIQEQRIKTEIPEFKWADTQVIVGVPEFFMQQQRIVMGLPQFTLNSVAINSKPLRDRSENLQNRVAVTRSQMMAEQSGSVNVLYSCYRSQIVAGRASAAVQFNNGLAQVDAIIQSIRSQGGNPNSLKAADGTVTDLVATRSDIIAKRDLALSSFDKALSDLDAAEKQTVTKMTGNAAA